MSYPINYPTPQGANIQIFQEGGTTSDWVKPQGASFVWFTLIGAGGSGGDDGEGSGGGGGSGAVTNFMGPAFLMPDILRVSVGKGGQGQPADVASTASSIVYQTKNGTGYTLLTASAGGNANTSASGAGGAATSAGPFAASGFYQSIAGQGGGTAAASSTTFLSGGAAINQSVLANYGYSLSFDDRIGFSMFSPIIVGVGSTSSSNGGTTAGQNKVRPGFGCGGGGTSGSTANGTWGGHGLVVIITW
jgi:hypothetical protein